MDWYGNSTDSAKTVHGIAEGPNGWAEACGFDVLSAGPEHTVTGLNSLVTCKACRTALGLAEEA